jgi:hypothetical protein
VKKIKTKEGTIKVLNNYSGTGTESRSTHKTVDHSIIGEVTRLREDMKRKELDHLNVKIDALKSRREKTENLIVDQLDQQRKILLE